MLSFYMGCQEQKSYLLLFIFFVFGEVFSAGEETLNKLKTAAKNLIDGFSLGFDTIRRVFRCPSFNPSFFIFLFVPVYNHKKKENPYERLG